MLLVPIAERWEVSARGHGRPTIAMSLFVRLMVVKQRSGWGYETLVREVSDSQLRRSTQRARQIKRLQDLHDFLRVLHQARLPRRASLTRHPGLQASQDRTVGRSDGHPWGDPVAGNREFQRPPTGRISWPPSPATSRRGPPLFAARPPTPAVSILNDPTICH